MDFPIEYLLAWVALAGLVGMLANGRGKGFAGYFLLSLVLSPLVGFIVLLVSGDGQQRAPCWQCKERVVVGASKCAHCGAELVWNQPSST